MTNPIFLSSASASDIKAMVETGKVDPTLAIERVDSVLARKTLTEGSTAEVERLVKENDYLQMEIHRLQEEVELWKSRCEDKV